MNEAGAVFLNGALLTTNSVMGTTLMVNTVTSFNAANSGGVVLLMTNTAAPLTITWYC